MPTSIQPDPALNPYRRNLKMRLRGLPREINCGNVELTPARGCRLTPRFQTCSSCDFTDVKYFRLDCNHIHCENCLVFYEMESDDLYAQCSTCNEARVAREERTPIATLYLARFECPCGAEGNLHFLSRHRRLCRQSRREQAPDLDLSQASASSTSSITSISSSSFVKKKSRLDSEMTQSIEFIVKGYIAEELKRMKEDIINTTRTERQTSDTNIQRALDRADYLESRLEHFNTLETRLEGLERSAGAMRSDPTILARLSSIDIQVQGLRGGDYLREIAAQQFTRHQSRSSFLWFDVKSLLRDFNRTRSACQTADQTLLLAGYPCKLHLQIDQDEGIKSLLVYLGSCDDLTYSANWPMRRQLTFRIYDTNGETVFENSFSTTDPSCREYFKGPGFDSFGFYFGTDLCTTEELTTEGFYQRSNGMVCLGISASPCGGTFLD